MRRSALSVVLAVALTVVVGLARPIAAQVIVAGPTTSDLLASIGDRVTMPIAIDMTGAGGYNLGAFRARFSWNPLVFDLVDATGGTFANQTSCWNFADFRRRVWGLGVGRDRTESRS